VLEKYPQEVKIVFKSYPLRNHKFAIKAAIAVFAARKMGKFWEFHDRLFENYDRLNDQTIREIVLDLGLDEKEFKKKMKDPTITARIRKDIQIASSAGVRGTPAIFINGRRLKGRTMNNFQAAIERELIKIRKAGGGKA